MNGEATAYEQVTRQMVESLAERFEGHEQKQNSVFEKIDQRLEKIETLVNSRPTWGTSALITILTGVTVALVTYILTSPR